MADDSWENPSAEEGGDSDKGRKSWRMKIDRIKGSRIGRIAGEGIGRIKGGGIGRIAGGGIGGIGAGAGAAAGVATTVAAGTGAYTVAKKGTSAIFSPAGIAIILGLAAHLMDLYVWDFWNGTPVILFHLFMAVFMLVIVFKQEPGRIFLTLLGVYLLINSGASYVMHRIGISDSGMFTFYIVGIVSLIAVLIIIQRLSAASSKPFNMRAFLIVGVAFFLQIGGIEAIELIVKPSSQWLWAFSQAMWPMWIIVVAFFASDMPDEGSQHARTFAFIVWLIIIIQMVLINIPIWSPGSVIEGPISDANVVFMERWEETNPIQRTWCGIKCRFEEIKTSTRIDADGVPIRFNYEKCATECLGLDYEEDIELAEEKQITGIIDESLRQNIYLDLNIDQQNREIMLTDEGVSVSAFLDIYAENDVIIKLSCGIEGRDQPGDVHPKTIEVTGGREAGYIQDVTCDLGQAFGYISRSGTKVYVDMVIEGGALEATSDFLIYFINPETLQQKEDEYLSVPENKRKYFASRNTKDVREARIEMYKNMPDFNTQIATDYKWSNGVIKSASNNGFSQLSVEPRKLIAGIKENEEILVMLTIKNLYTEQGGEIRDVLGGYLEMPDWLVPVEGECDIITGPKGYINEPEPVPGSAGKHKYSMSGKILHSFGISGLDYKEYKCWLKINEIPAYGHQIVELQGEWLRASINYDYKARSEGILTRATSVQGCGIGKLRTCNFMLPFDERELTDQEKRVSSCYGFRYLEGDEDFHDGVDFPLDVGRTVLAVAAGEIYDIMENICVGDDCTGRGNTIIIKHSPTLYTIYSHLSSTGFPTSWQKGRRVYQGELIAKSGNTGYSTGAHLHFGIDNDDDGNGIPFDLMPGPLLDYPPEGESELNPECFLPIPEDYFKHPDVGESCKSYEEEVRRCRSQY